MIIGQKEILNHTRNYSFDSVLDIGLGRGEASSYFKSLGKEVHAVGHDVYSYDISKETLDNIKIYHDLDVTSMSCFEDNKFDAVWCAHVIEHTFNPGLALKEIHRILKEDGILFLTVPPYKTQIVGGHLSTGWNIGMMMYWLILHGFDIQHGSFIKHEYNVSGFVRKRTVELPDLGFRNGDLEAMNHLFPIEVFQGVEGDIDSINWEWKDYQVPIKRRFERKIKEKCQLLYTLLTGRQKLPKFLGQVFAGK